MKLINSVIIIGFLAASWGCNRFIDLEPKSVSNSTTFYNSEAGIQQGINGIYSVLQTLYGTGSSFWAMTEERADNTTFQFDESNRGAQQREDIDYFLVTPDNNYIEQTWQVMYQAIAQANTILNHVDDVDMAEGDRDKYVGQAKFIRALMYFNLVRLFGGVPIELEEVSDPAEAFSKSGRATSEQVYEQINDDINDAISKLPPSWPTNELGRATKGAAYTLKGEMFMTLKQFDKAIPVFDSVMNLGYSLFPDYAGLFNPANKNGEESIFEIQFSASVEGEASDFIYTFAPLFSGYQTIAAFDPNSGGGRNIPTRDIQETYEANDVRKDASIGWFIDAEVNAKYAEAQHDSIPYILKFAAAPSSPSKQSVNFPVYRYAQVLLWYAEALNETGVGDPYLYLNEVRERANLTPLSGLPKNDLRAAIYHEERVESAFEDHRWFQLLRTNSAVSVMNNNGTEQKSYQTWLPNESYNIQEYKLLFPIPKREVDLNHLAQNPGWPN